MATDQDVICTMRPKRGFRVLCPVGFVCTTAAAFEPGGVVLLWLAPLFLAATWLAWRAHIVVGETFIAWRFWRRRNLFSLDRLDKVELVRGDQTYAMKISLYNDKGGVFVLRTRFFWTNWRTLYATVARRVFKPTPGTPGITTDSGTTKELSAWVYN